MGLICYPCPHSSICCSWGSSLEPDEAEGIKKEYSEDYIVLTGDPTDPIRTAVRNGSCVFKILEPGGGCSIHDKPYYPKICRGFPDSDGKDGPYLGDITICPELNEPRNQ